MLEKITDSFYIVIIIHQIFKVTKYTSILENSIMRLINPITISKRPTSFHLDASNVLVVISFGSQDSVHYINKAVPHSRVSV